MSGPGQAEAGLPPLGDALGSVAATGLAQRVVVPLPLRWESAPISQDCDLALARQQYTLGPTARVYTVGAPRPKWKSWLRQVSSLDLTEYDPRVRHEDLF